MTYPGKIKKNKSFFRDKQLIVFDLDGTLTESKSSIDADMVALLIKLLEKKRVAIIGGGKYGQFKKQLLEYLPHRDRRLKNLFLFPTTANAFYRYQTSWKNIYALQLPRADKIKIKKALKEVLREIKYVPPKKIYGTVLEDRGTQMSFSPLGQEVVTQLGNRGIRLKEAWKKKNNNIRLKIKKLLAEKLPKFEVRVGGITTIDITRKGIDKAYGIKQIKKTLNMPIRQMLFIGDALYRGGNDEAAKKTGIDCVAVKGPIETKKIVEKIINKD